MSWQSILSDLSASIAQTVSGQSGRMSETNYMNEENFAKRIKCYAQGCQNTILPSTAESTDGLCMPCFKIQQRLEREEYIKNNRKTVNLYEEGKDLVEIIKIYHKPKIHDPLIQYTRYQHLINETYQSLDDAQISKLIDYAIYEFRNNKDSEAKRIIAGLVDFINADVTKFLMEMVRVDDYEPVFLFKGSQSVIRQKLLNNFLQHKVSDGSLFETLVFLAEKEEKQDKINKEIIEAIREFKKLSLTIRSGVEVSRKDGFKKSILGNINICTKDEAWPEHDGVVLNPVLQLSIQDLPYIPTELHGTKYICIFKHPEDPDVLVIRSYNTDNVNFIEAPHSIQQDALPTVIEFQKMNDYPCDYSYIHIEKYLAENYERCEHDSYELQDGEWLAGRCKILGWPVWIQDPVFPSNSEFILQIDSYDLWDDGDTSTLYVFRDLATKEFFGFTQMY